MKLTSELIEKAKSARSVEELLKLASENEIELTGEEAKVYFDHLNPKQGALSDSELDNVAGGGCHADDGYMRTTRYNSCWHWEGSSLDGYKHHCKDCRYAHKDWGTYICKHEANREK